MTFPWLPPAFSAARQCASSTGSNNESAACGGAFASAVRAAGASSTSDRKASSTSRGRSWPLVTATVRISIAARASGVSHTDSPFSSSEAFVAAEPEPPRDRRAHRAHAQSKVSNGRLDALGSNSWCDGMYECVSSSPHATSLAANIAMLPPSRSDKQLGSQLWFRYAAARKKPAP